MNTPNVASLLSRLGIKAHDEEIYHQALTHRSVNGAANTVHQDYERLEFLGDSLVGLVVGELCYRYHPEMEEGDLSKLKAQFIRTESEASYALKLGLEAYIRVGPSFRDDVKTSLPLLEDVFEAFIGAIILDQGRDYAYAFTYQIFEKDVATAQVEEASNPIGELNECFQAETTKPITYKQESEEGPSNDKYYVFSANFDGRELGRGGGKSKDAAKAAAAASALDKMALHADALSQKSTAELLALYNKGDPDWGK
jgi:ribonuclease-3